MRASPRHWRFRNRTVLGTSLAMTLLAIQFSTIASAPSDLAVRVVLPATIALAPLALWPLRHHFGIWVMFVGLAANLAAIVANGGLMPIERATVIEAIGVERAAPYETGAWIKGSKDVLVADGGGNLTALGDSIIVRTRHRGFAASPGDIVVWCGLALLAGEASWRWHRSRRLRAPAATVETGRAEGSAPTPQ